MLSMISDEELQIRLGSGYDMVKDLAYQYEQVCVAGGAAFAMLFDMPVLTDIDVFVLGQEFEMEYAMGDAIHKVYTKAKTVGELLRGFPISAAQIAMELERSHLRDIHGPIRGRFVCTKEFEETIRSGKVKVDTQAYFTDKHLDRHVRKWVQRMYWLKKLGWTNKYRYKVIE